MDGNFLLLVASIRLKFKLPFVTATLDVNIHDSK
jgi:hypothetical protein